MAMTPDLKAKWVAALRSGEFKQGQGVLWDGIDRFCCLGVLCKVAEIPIGSVYTYPTSFMPLGLTRAQTSVCGGGAESFVAMNDSGVTFPEIADYIEREL